MLLELDLDWQSSGARVDDFTHANDLRAEGLAGTRVDRDFRGRTDGDIEGFTRIEQDARFEEAGVGEREERAARREVLAWF